MGRKYKIMLLLILVILIINTNLNTISAFDKKKDNYDLLIIAPEEFKNLISPLVKHKNNFGVTTKLVTTIHIYNIDNLDGRDKQEKIKYFIKFAIEEWDIKYVLLIGGMKGLSLNWYIPVRYIYLYDDSYEYPVFRFISDLYYADIYDYNGDFSSWDTNNNNVFGEWIGQIAEDSEIDLYPDVSIGRLPCRNKLEVKIMINKIINYENNCYSKDWFLKIITVAGDSYPISPEYPNSSGYEGEDVSKRIIENMSDFKSINLWTSNGNLTNEFDVIQAINQGCGFIYFHGHSNPKFWATRPPNDNNTWINGLSNTYIPLYCNRYMLPICVIHGCKSLQFDVTPWNLLFYKKRAVYYMTYVFECLGWRFTRKIGGGSIATIGCTDLGKTREDKESFEEAGELIDIRFFWEYGVNKTDIIGNAWRNSINYYLKKHPIDWATPAMSDYAIDVKTVQQWILFGDPSLKIGGYH